MLILLKSAVASNSIILLATGRAPNTKRLNLEAVGAELDKAGAVKVTFYNALFNDSIEKFLVPFT